MILLIGLCTLGIALLFAVLGVGSNTGPSHLLNGDFALFGQHMTGLSTGRLFLFGIMVGLVAALGLSILRGFFARGLASRDLQKALKKSQGESATLRADFGRLRKELDAEKAHSLSLQAEKTPPVGETPSPTM